MYESLGFKIHGYNVGVPSFKQSELFGMSFAFDIYSCCFIIHGLRMCSLVLKIMANVCVLWF